MPKPKTQTAPPPAKKSRAKTPVAPSLGFDLGPAVPLAGRFASAGELEIGLDEAGRGPILGPMVLACVALDEQATSELQALGVTDSKRFGAGVKAHTQRAALVEQIHARARHIEVWVIEVHEIDARTRRGELNRLEQEVALQLLGRAPTAARIIADGERIFAPLGRHYPHLRAENKADQSCIAVAAASLCAKVRRDELWHQIKGRYEAEFGEFLAGFAGGGYLNDATRSFLRAYCARYRRIPPEGRASWPWDFVAEHLDVVTAADERSPSLRLNLELPQFQLE